MNRAPYPWLQEAWSFLSERLRRGSLPQALLFTGPRGLGKYALARHLANALVCEAGAADAPCGECRGCVLYLAGTHPDAREVCPAEPGKAIGIDAVRGACQWLGLTPSLATRQAAIIEPADQLNSHSANSLLKTLEEPTPRSVLMLVTHRPAALLPTIRSRCQRIALSVPPMDQAQPWLADKMSGEGDARLLLKLAGGAPLAALAWVESDGIEQRAALWTDLRRLARAEAEPLSLAESWLKNGARQTLYTMHGWLTDLIRLRVLGDEYVTNTDMAGELREMARRVDTRRLFQLLDQANEGLRLTDTQVNPQLLLENVAIGWVAAFARADDA